MANYSEMTDAEFQAILTEMVSELPAEAILAYGEVNAFFREEFNNAILDRWAEKNPEKANKPKPVRLRGDRSSVENQVWDRFVQGGTPEDFVDGYASPEEAIKDLVENLDPEDVETFKTDWGEELTLEEVLLSYLKRKLEEKAEK